MFTKFTRYILPLERFREKRERDTTKKVKGKGRKRKYPWIQNTTRKEDLKSESEGKRRARRNYDRFAGPICMRRVISDSDCRISSFMSMQVTRALATSII